MTTYFLTRYAFSSGGKIKPLDDPKKSSSGEYVIDGPYHIHKIGRDVFTDSADAISAAEAMRTKKIESLKKQIKKLESLEFKVVQP